VSSGPTAQGQRPAAEHFTSAAALVRERETQGSSGEGKRGAQELMLVLYKPREGEGEGAATVPIGH
jgi:hypothetical protein